MIIFIRVRDKEAIGIFDTRGIELKFTPAELLARIICILLAVFVLLLLILSLLFSFGNEAPSLFGSNVYIMKTDAFEIIEQGSAIIAKKVSYADILPGNIVIYINENKKAALAEIHSSEYIDNVYSFTGANEEGMDLILTQSQILGKAMTYSPFLGGLIRFAKSPAGVMLIAVIPCFTVLGYEVFRFILYRLKGVSPVAPIKKQDEVPTFVPRPKVDKAVSAYKNIRGHSENDDDNNSDTSEGRGLPPRSVKRENDGYLSNLPGRAPNTDSDYPLYRMPQKTPPPIEKPKPKQMPLSQKRLNEVIAETKAKQARLNPVSPATPISPVPPISPAPPATPITPAENAVRNTPANFTQNTQELNRVSLTNINNATSVNENLKHYTPRKQASSQRLHTTQTIPRLDELLRDDSENNTVYDITSILNSFDKNKQE